MRVRGEFRRRREKEQIVLVGIWDIRTIHIRSYEWYLHCEHCSTIDVDKDQ